jgi:xylan 1,4-beta-xylosidase
MEGNRVEVGQSGLSYDYARIRDKSVRDEPDINGLASKNGKSAAVMVWNYHDDNVPAPDAPVTLKLSGIPASRATVHHYRIDAAHSNAYEVWKKMGSPRQPTATQITELEKAGQLQMLRNPETVSVKNGQAEITFALPRQGVSLVKLAW